MGLVGNVEDTVYRELQIAALRYKAWLNEHHARVWLLIAFDEVIFSMKDGGTNRCPASPSQRVRCRKN